MKRDRFSVTGPDNYSKIKYAWNSALRQIEAKIREIARREDTTYELVDSSTVKSDKWTFVSGTRTWKSRDGKIVNFEIRRLA